MTANTVKHDGLVAQIIDYRKIVLNKGAQNGISEGDKFVVFSLGEEVHDPRTGESLGILEEIKGKGKVIHVQEYVCTIETYEFEIEMVSIPRSMIERSLNPFLGSTESKKEKIYRHFTGVKCGDYARKI